MKYNSWTKVYSFVILLSFFTSACRNNETPVRDIKITPISPIDSFTIYGISGASGALYVSNMTTDKKLIFFGSQIENAISIYQRNEKGDYNFKESKVYLPQESASFVEKKDNTFYFFRGKRIFTYDTLTKIKKSYIVTEKKKYLNDNYVLADANYHPILFNHDTIIAGFYNKSIELRNEWFNEKALSIYKMQNDSLIHLKDIIDRPESIKKTANIDFSFNQTDRKVSLIFNGIDTIYTYDLNKNAELKIPINNPYFKKNQVFDLNKNMNQSYVANYEKDNFRYEGFFFNENTQHFVLFFFAPYLQKDPIPFQSNMYVLVMNKEYKILKIHNLGNATLHGFSMINIPGKGFAIPTLNLETNEKLVPFHIYNF